MFLLVSHQKFFMHKPFVTEPAFELPLAVYASVLSQELVRSESSSANVTNERPFVRVRSPVKDQRGLLRERLAADVALEMVSFGMDCFHVSLQRLALHEDLIASLARVKVVEKLRVHFPRVTPQSV